MPPWDMHKNQSNHASINGKHDKMNQNDKRLDAYTSNGTNATINGSISHTTIRCKEFFTLIFKNQYKFDRKAIHFIVKHMAYTTYIQKHDGDTSSKLVLDLESFCNWSFESSENIDIAWQPPLLPDG